MSCCKWYRYRFMFWFGVRQSESRIYKHAMYETELPYDVIATDLPKLSQFAIDYIDRKLYWTAGNYRRSSATGIKSSHKSWIMLLIMMTQSTDRKLRSVPLDEKMDLMIFASKTNLRHFKVSLFQAPRWWGKRIDKKTRKTALGLRREGHKLVFFFFLLLVRFFSLVYTDRKPGTGYIERLVVEIK